MKYEKQLHEALEEQRDTSRRWNCASGDIVLELCATWPRRHRVFAILRRMPSEHEHTLQVFRTDRQIQAAFDRYSEAATATTTNTH